MLIFCLILFLPNFFFPLEKSRSIKLHAVLDFVEKLSLRRQRGGQESLIKMHSHAVKLQRERGDVLPSYTTTCSGLRSIDIADQSKKGHDSIQPLHEPVPVQTFNLR